MASEQNFVFVPFKQSMNVSGNASNKWFQEFENVYEKRNPSVFKSAGWPMIPKKIHQIWLYNSAIPVELSKNIELWKEMYPDWEYKLWLIDDINSLELSMQDLYRKTRKISEKLDIAKFEILHKFGGIYIDIHYVPIQNMSYLSNYYKFYAGLDAIKDNKSDIEVSTALIASRPNELFIKKTLVAIREEWHKQKYYKDFTKDVFNKVVRANLASDQKSIVFPTSYFGVVTRDHPLISFVSKYIFFRPTAFFNKIHKETIAAKQRY
jgi:mannosyltransferase OCH1-like enzyme